MHSTDILADMESVHELYDDKMHSTDSLVDMESVYE